jgi:hypothetical protein
VISTLHGWAGVYISERVVRWNTDHDPRTVANLAVADPEPVHYRRDTLPPSPHSGHVLHGRAGPARSEGSVLLRGSRTANALQHFGGDIDCDGKGSFLIK